MSSSVIWCLGVPGSASTWTFNAVRLLHSTAGLRATSCFAYLNRPLNLDVLGGPGNFIVKSHVITSVPTVAFLQEKSRVIIITIRDPRDSVSSLIRSKAAGFKLALANVEETLELCAQVAARPNAYLMRYETRFFENAATIPALAQALGYQVPEIAMNGIFDMLTREEVEKYIATLPRKPGMKVNPETKDFYDPKTHWHTHHAGRTGESGSFQSCLTATQITEVEKRLSKLYSFERHALISG